MTIMLLDGDTIVYGAAFGAQETVDWGDGELMATASSSVATTAAEDHIHEIHRAVTAEMMGSSDISLLREVRIVVALSDPTECFRRRFWPTYKMARKQTHRPLAYGAVRDYLKANYECVERPGLEGDDVLGILATGDVRGFRGEKVMVSIDKDMRTVPGRLYNPMRPDAGIVETGEALANYAFYMQILTGDSVDGYPGCPGIGPKRADKILDEVCTYEIGGEAAESSKYEQWCWEEIVATYARAGLTEADALIQARCARILRASDYDFKNKEVIPWEPNRDLRSDS
jgi:DNA polymerase-1